MFAARLSGHMDSFLDVARPAMTALRDASGETVHIAMLAGVTTRFPAAAESRNIMRVGSRVGDTLPARMTAAGKLLLSYLSHSTLALLFRDERLNDRSLGDDGFRELMSDLRHTRIREFGVNHDESEPGVSAIAVPIRDMSGEPICALTLSGPTFRFHSAPSASLLSEREAELLRLLRGSATGIEARFRQGAREGPARRQGDVPATGTAARSS
jgi:DNA-binding IclR family transcriptional regulator